VARRSWLGRLADPVLQSRLARLPILRGLARREGEAMFDLVSGFVQSQMLRALVELEVLEALTDAPASAAELAPRIGLSPDRTEILLRAGVAMGLLSLRRGRFRASPRGAVLTGVPGLPGMIRHHDILYRDLSDPVAFLRGETEPELARFWPYVIGGSAGAAEARRYSRLMSDSQALVAEETLAQVDLGGIGRLMDVGGGAGVFLSRALERRPAMAGMLVDLPAVLDEVPRGLAARVALRPLSFRQAPLPEGADAISLVRVLYDHDEETVRDLLSKARSALPVGGRLIVSEPMTGGGAPTRAGDVYFAIYCAAMGTGRARSALEIAALLREVGFARIRCPRPRRAFVTSVVEARK
jgi:demethylspheroidene O-methyltransferase